MQTALPNHGSIISRCPFLLLLAALISGILLQAGLKLTVPALLLCTLSTALLALALHYLRSPVPALTHIRLIILLLSFTGTGAVLSALQDARTGQQWYGHHISGAQAMLVTLQQDPVPKNKTLLLEARVLKIMTGHSWKRVNGEIKLYVYRQEHMPRYTVGQTLLIPATLQPVRSSGNPYAFDYASFSAKHNLYHQAFLPVSAITVISRTEKKASLLTGIRASLSAGIAINVTDSTTRSLMEAVLLNERSGLDEGLWRAYSATGIVHIIAISGMHIALLAGISLLVLRSITFRRWKPLPLVAVILFIWCYVALTGFPPSAVRAALMFTLATLATLMQRHSNPVNTWAATGFLMLCYNPFWLYDIGAQLSFLAVLSILLFYDPLRKLLTPGNILLQRLWQTVALSLSVQVLIAPLVIYYFHQFPVMGLAANIPAALFSMLLLYGALLLLLLHSCGIPALWLGQGLSWLTKGFNTIILFLSHHTPAVLQQLYLDPFGYWLMMLAIAAACLYLFRKQVFFFYLSLLAAIVLCSDFIINDILAAQQDRMVVYNISRQSAVDIFRGRKAIRLWDTLPESQYRYAVFPGRLGLRTSGAEGYSRDKLFLVRGARVLLLDQQLSLHNSKPLPVDFLVVSDHCRFDPEGWYHTFHPRKVIIDGSLPRWKAAQWKQRLREAGAMVHWVQEDGAWVYPALRR